MQRLNFTKLSAREVVYAGDMALACLITYWVMVFLLPHFVTLPTASVGPLWAVISTVFVYKDTRAHSVSAGIARLSATFVSFVLCSIYLLLLPATALGIGALIAIGTLFMIFIGRRDEVGLTAITIAVIMIIAASNPQDAWLQPPLRLADTIIGVTIGVACKWVCSYLFFRISGEEVG